MDGRENPPPPRRQAVRQAREKSLPPVRRITENIRAFSDFPYQSCLRLGEPLSTARRRKAGSLQDALRKGRKLMGKLVQFQRGIATVIPDCVRRSVSQKASLRGFFNRLRLTDP